MKLVSSTNGHLFKKKAAAEKLISSGLDSIIFAVDGISQETYEPYRQGGSLESVLQAIRTVVARRRELNSRTPFVNLRFIVMKHNEHEIPKLRGLAKSLGVDALTLKTLNPVNQDFYSENKSEVRIKNEFPPQDHDYHRFKYDSTGQDVIRVRRNPCKQVWNNPVIHWSGAVCSCTYDPKEKYVLGHLKHQTSKTFGWEYHIAVCVAISVPIGGNSPFAATAAMPMREEIALTKSLPMPSSLVLKTVVKEVPEWKETEKIPLMPEKPQLSIIVASYNSRKTIESCLESLKNQKTYKTVLK